MQLDQAFACYLGLTVKAAIIQCLLSAKHHLHILYDSICLFLMMVLWLFPFYRWGNRGTKRLGNLS